jgi:hypothetical protein
VIVWWGDPAPPNCDFLLAAADVHNAIRRRGQFQIHQSRSYVLKTARCTRPNQFAVGQATKYVVYRCQVQRRILDREGCVGALKAAFAVKAPTVGVFDDA